MFDEDYIVDEDLEQLDYSTPNTSKQSFDKGKQIGREVGKKIQNGSLKEDLSQVKEGFNDIKGGNISDGLSKVKNGIIDDRNAIEKTGHDIKEAGKAMQKGSQLLSETGDKLKQANKVGKKVNDAVEKGAKGAKAASDALDKKGKLDKTIGDAGKAASGAVDVAGEVADATVAGAPLGVVLNAIGKAGKGLSNVKQAEGNIEQGLGKSGKAAAGAVEKGAQAGKLGNKVGEKFGDAAKKAGDIGNKASKKLQDMGSKIEKTGKDLKNEIKPLKGTAEVVAKLPKILIIGGIVAAVLMIALSGYTSLSSLTETIEKFGTYEEDQNFLESTSSLFLSENMKDNKKFYEELNNWYSKSNGQLDVPLVLSVLFYTNIDNSDNEFDFSEDNNDGEDDYNDINSLDDKTVSSFQKGLIKRLRLICKNMLDNNNNPVSDEDFKEFLRKKYINKKPEFKGYFDESSNSDRDNIIEYIINEMYEFRDRYVQIYGDGKDELASEGYDNSCLGAINNNLVSELKIPVDISGTVSFDASSSFGIVDGKVHNGVDLNSSSAGVLQGNSVYSIHNGEVVAVQQDLNNIDQISNFLFIGDARIDKISSLLNQYGNVLYVDNYKLSDWAAVTDNTSGSIDLPRQLDVSGISIMFSINNMDFDNLKILLNNLHSKYPSITIYLNSIYHVGEKYEGDVTNKKIDTYNNKMLSFCNDNLWCRYVDVSNSLYGDNDNLKDAYSTDGIHITSDEGKTTLVSNLVDGITKDITEETGGTWIKIKHAKIIVKENEYTFYSVYKNLDSSSVSLKVGDTVSKGDIIGKVGTTNEGVSQLHFEFRNEKDEAIDPTNLFVKCVSGTTDYLIGESNEEKVWNYLTSYGYSKYAAAGIMGNWQHESGFLPNNLENTSNSKSGVSDEEFTAMVNSGEIDRGEFKVSTKYGVYRDNSYGYGLAQWTYPSRKVLFYDFYKESNKNVDDLKMQLDFYVYEKNKNYPTLDESIESKVNSSITDDEAVVNAAKTYRSIYERGTLPEKREEYAKELYAKYKNYVAPTINLADMGQGVREGISGTENPSENGDGYPDGTYTSSINNKQFKRYKQYLGEWAEESYWNGTMHKSGCGPTAVAVLASGLIDFNITPYDIAQDMDKNFGYTGSDPLKGELENLGLSAEVKFGPTSTEILNYLYSGNVLLISTSNSLFTNGSHIMAIVDVNSSGQVYVINPGSGNDGWYNASTIATNCGYIVITPAK